MPTLVRSVCKVALFVLVMAVSGVGAAQAQTDPSVAPPIPDAVVTDSAVAGVITPDVVRQSARLYATTEQVSRAITSGNVEYWFSETLIISERGVEHFTEWAFYKINGDETNFFVDTYSVATGKEASSDPYDDYKVIDSNAVLCPDISAARLQEFAPSSAVDLPEDRPATFSLAYGGASVSRTIPASPNTRLYSNSITVDDGLLCHSMSMQYAEHHYVEDLPSPEALAGGVVARWEGGSPWGMKLSAGGWAVSSPVIEGHRWGVTQQVEE